MFGLRGLARTLLASVFVIGGVDAWRRSAVLASSASAITDPIEDLAPGQPNAEQLVKVNAAVQVVGGVLFALGVAPRVLAMILGGSLGATTLAGHRFWEIDDDAERAHHRVHFVKNAGLLGGLAFVALDTGGRPSVFWSGRKAAEGAVAAVAATTQSVRDSLDR